MTDNAALEIALEKAQERIRCLEEENRMLKDELGTYPDSSVSRERERLRLMEEEKVRKKEEARLREERMKRSLQERIREENERFNLTTQKKVEIFMSLFRGRADVFARRWYSRKSQKSGYQPVCRNHLVPGICDLKKTCQKCANRAYRSLEVTDVYAHLAGKSPDGADVIGIYPVMLDNKVSFLCADFDDKSCEHGYKEDVRAYVAVCRKYDVPCYVERSRSGNGAHVWIFFSCPVPAYKARRLGSLILTEAMENSVMLSFKSYDRFFPNQDFVPAGGLGNLVALPLQGNALRQGNSVFVDDDFQPFEFQWGLLQSVVRMDTGSLEELLQEHPAVGELGDLSRATETKPWETPKPVNLSFEDFVGLVEVVRSNMLYVPLRSVSPKVINHLKRLASFRNPEFYAKQGMRLSTFGLPRVISCAEVLDEYLAIPRGCEEELVEIFRQNFVNYSFVDKTNSGTTLDVSFNGVLREEQQMAVAALLEHRCGVLSAVTAFGKTVAAAALIAARKVNTLVLVNSRALLEQWKSSLMEFLTLEYEEPEVVRGRGRHRKFDPIGTRGAGKDTLHGMVDVAIMQSLLENEEGVKELVRNYGMVIVDECHHVSAVTFERILRYANARYVYGLTATPVRKDGHQPVIFMQCGKIRFVAESKIQDFERHLVPRFTSSRLLEDKEYKYVDIVRLLSEDVGRNQMLVDDIVEAVERGRTPVVLARLKEQVILLADALRKLVPNIVVLIGSDSARNKRLEMERLRAVPPDEKLVLVSTYKFVGEGFDFPRLDTLFLAAPVSWKFDVVQFAGRLHRSYPGKEYTEIYDYIDVHIPMCEGMYRNRLKAYEMAHYRPYMATVLSEPDAGMGYWYDSQSYHSVFWADVSGAQKSVVISSGIPLERVGKTARDLLEKVQRNGVLVKLVSSSSNSLSCAVIDGCISWYGSVKFLEGNKPDANCMRLTDVRLATELVDVMMERK